jgi:hypothetical protein
MAKLEPDLVFRQIGWVFVVAHEWVGLQRRCG